MEEDPRFERILEVIRQLAAGDFDVSPAPSGEYDSYDAIMIGLAMLAEELAASTVSVNEYQAKVAELEEAMAQVHTLSGLLPMCAWCKKVRDDDGYWKQIEQYVRENSDARITHGICPSCRDGLKT